MADHEDYLPGEAPAAHKTTHQDGGADEVNIEGLTGITSYMAAHILLPTVHQDAPALILTHKGDASAHHARYTDGEAVTQADARIAIHSALPTVHQDAPALIAFHAAIVAAHHARYTDGEAIIQADARIGIHAALPTVHQDAPALILTHKGDASAHHAKYTDAEARVLHSPISIPATAFIPALDTYAFVMESRFLYNRGVLSEQIFYAPLYFPHAVTITKLTLYGYRIDAAAIMTLILQLTDRGTTTVDMATVTANWTTGYSNLSDETISFALIDNTTRGYMLKLILNPNDSDSEIRLSGAMIDFTG